MYELYQHIAKKTNFFILATERIGKGVDWDYHTDFDFRTSYNINSVEGGRLVADIAGGLEGLAVNLADTEVGLRAVGAI